jgi:hypothetical protein
MADEPNNASSELRAQDRPADPFVARRPPDSGEPLTAYRVLQGLWSESNRPGYRRLYLTTALTSYAEFSVDDVVNATDIPADATPFPGEQATRVSLRGDAAVNYTRTKPASTDPFDLDVRLGRAMLAADSGPFEPSEDPLNCPAPATGGLDTCHPPDSCFGCPIPTEVQTECIVCPTDITCGTCPPDATCETCEAC